MLIKEVLAAVKILLAVPDNEECFVSRNLGDFKEVLSCAVSISKLFQCLMLNNASLHRCSVANTANADIALLPICGSAN